MIKKITFALMSTFAAATAMADPAPFGFELNKASLEQVKAGTTGFSLSGYNKFTGGPMLQGSGAEFGLEGLREVTFVFDGEEVLHGVLLDMPKYRFDAINSHLLGKYTLEEELIPFVGNKYTRYRDGDSTVEIHSPHLSFDMQVIYQTDALELAYETTKAAERQAKQNHEGGQL